MNKKILMIMFGLLISLFSAYSADFYTVYDASFTDERPSSIFVTGGDCTSSACSSVSQNLEVFHGTQAVACMDTARENGNVEQFNSCMQNAKVQGSVPMSGNSKIVVKTNYPSSFGTLTYFLASGDSYLPVFDRSPFYTCNFEICFNEVEIPLTFEKKVDAIAEVGRVNIKNLDNQLLPVQIEVPVAIEQTVCSAYRRVNSDWWLPSIPTGYSDFSANTQIRLEITKDGTSQTLLEESVNIPILADTCAGLAAFSWRPSADLENEAIKFRVETDVIDNQVINSITDFAEVVEVVYPINLDNTCWVRAFDFTLSNTASQDLTTSLAQITVGETLYANFRGGAYRDNSITPMNYEAKVLFNGQVVETKTLSSSENLAFHSFDLSSKILNLDAGTYTVSLVTTPVGSNCDVIEPVTQTQQLVLLEPEKYNVNFLVTDSQGVAVPNAEVRLVLLSADDYFQVPPTYSLTQTTNAQGRTTFTNAFIGTYDYFVSASNYETVSNSVRVGSNTDVYVTLNTGNSNPTINLPEEFIIYYEENIEFDIRDYVLDYNDAFSTLNINHEVVSGNINVNYNSPTFTISSATPQEAVLRVSVTDPQGASSQDTVSIKFIDNSAPVIRGFFAEPTNGAIPFQTIFTIDVIDSDSEELTCTLDLGDGTAPRVDTCANLNGVGNTYTSTGTYTVSLSVDDGVNEPVTSSIFVFAFEREYSSPVINSFGISATNNFRTPSDVTLTWDVTHPDELETTCSLRINGVEETVSCSSSSKIINSWERIGESTFVLLAVDSEGHQVFRELKRTFTGNSAPVIRNFFATPNEGTAPLETTFTIDTFDTDSDVLTCTLNLGDGSTSRVDTCSNLNGFTYTYSNVGNYVPMLSVSDGKATAVSASTSISVSQREFGNPSIDSFTIESSNNFQLPDSFTLRWAVSHPDDLSTTCTLSVNGVIQPVSCSGNQNFNNWNIEGNSVFVLRAVDSNDKTAQREIIRTFTRTPAPVINQFFANPNLGTAPHQTTFTIDVTGSTQNPLQCTLNFGDGTAPRVDTCSNLNGISYTYVNAGNYVVRLDVNDGVSPVVSGSTFVDVTQRQTRTPVIESFNVESSNNFQIPSNVSIDWLVSHPDDLSMTCTLSINGVVQPISCEGSTTIDNWNIAGSAVFTLRAVDTNNNATQREITRTFSRNSQPEIVEFFATPDNGPVPLETTFTINTIDSDSDELTCTLSLGDGSTPRVDSCSNLNGFTHTYTQAGTFRADLEVDDSNNEPVRALTFITVNRSTEGSPEIESFTISTPNNFNVPTIVTLDWTVTHPNNLPMECSLSVNGVVQNVACDGPFVINDWTQEGNSVFILRAVDSGNRENQRELTQIFTRSQDPLSISSFTATPTSGTAPLDVSFTSLISGQGRDLATCTLNFGNGNFVNDLCSVFESYQYTYSNGGSYLARLSIDSTSQFETVQISVGSVINTAPRINTFTATPISGVAPLEVLFETAVSDDENDVLSCIVEFGDGNTIGGLCNSLNNFSHIYTQAGTYNVVFRVSDSESEVFGFQTIEVLSQESQNPQITGFNVVSSTNFVLPTTLDFTWNILNPRNENLICTLDYEGNLEVVNCNLGRYVISDFNITGDVDFTLTVIDENLNEFTRTISKTFYTLEEIEIDPAKVNLIMGDTIIPGEFEFSIRVFDETLKKRQLDFRPVIVCQGVDNVITENNGFIRTSAISKKDGLVDTYTLKTDTDNYRLNVPTDEICTFRVEIVDEFGQILTLSKPVMFSYPVAEEQLLSIRGFGTDITNFMESVAISGNIKPGFNSIKFNVVNNEDFAKQISVSLISADLTLNVNERLSVAPGQTQAVNMVISIDENTQKGMYPVRISVNDGETRQTKYTFISIN